MSPSHPDPDRPDWAWDPEIAWEPDPPWEPEPESTPWSERERLRARDPRAGSDFDIDSEFDWPLGDDPAPAATPRARPSRVGSGDAPAYLAVAALLLVVFALALLTVGLFGQGHWARIMLAAGSAMLLVGLGLLALASRLAGGLERG
jgi:hypothetical protein